MSETSDGSEVVGTWRRCIHCHEELEGVPLSKTIKFCFLCGKSQKKDSPEPEVFCRNPACQVRLFTASAKSCHICCMLQQPDPALLERDDASSIEEENKMNREQKTQEQKVGDLDATNQHRAGVAKAVERIKQEGNDGGNERTQEKEATKSEVPSQGSSPCVNLTADAQGKNLDLPTSTEEQAKVKQEIPSEEDENLKTPEAETGTQPTFKEKTTESTEAKGKEGGHQTELSNKDESDDPTGSSSDRHTSDPDTKTPPMKPKTTTADSQNPQGETTGVTGKPQLQAAPGDPLRSSQNGNGNKRGQKRGHGDDGNTQSCHKTQKLSTPTGSEQTANSDATKNSGVTTISGATTNSGGTANSGTATSSGTTTCSSTTTSSTDSGTTTTTSGSGTTTTTTASASSGTTTTTTASAGSGTTTTTTASAGSGTTTTTTASAGSGTTTTTTASAGSGTTTTTSASAGSGTTTTTTASAGSGTTTTTSASAGSGTTTTTTASASSGTTTTTTASAGSGTTTGSTTQGSTSVPANKNKGTNQVSSNQLLPTILLGCQGAYNLNKSVFMKQLSHPAHAQILFYLILAGNSYKLIGNSYKLIGSTIQINLSRSQAIPTTSI